MPKGPTYKVYEFFGVDLPEESNGSGEFVTDCPFCGRERHFYINEETSLYKCQDATCGKEGNPYVFMEGFYQKALGETTPFAYRRLSKHRKGLSKDAFMGAGIAFSRDLHTFLIPDRNEKGSMVNLGQYSGKSGSPVYGAPDCSQHFFGLESLAKTGPVFVCEGRWDAIALKWLLAKIALPGEWSVLGAPGATNIPKADLPLLQGRDVYLLYDNDEAGRNGMKIAAKKLSPVAGSIHVLDWPENRFPDKYDVEDYVRETPDRLDKAWEELISWCFKLSNGADITVKAPQIVRNTLEELHEDFKNTGVHLYPGLRDFFTLTLAVVHSTALQGEPLWLYGIGDPGRGKSLILETALGSPKCIYRTSVTHKAFISGFRNQDGEDRALLNLLPGKCLIVKDYSNVLSLPHIEQEQLVSLLREAYDGRISRTFGNQLYREYPPADSPHNDCRFGLVAGVTKEIHSRSHAGLGERFLKYEIPCSEADNLKAMHAALDDSWKTHERQLHRAHAVGAFLGRDVPDSLPEIPLWFHDRLIAISQFVGFSRTPVSRSKGDLDYDPSPESGTRIIKQLKKFAQSICTTLNLSAATDEVYRLIRKVAWDTAHSWRRDLFLFLSQEDDRLNTHQISEATGLSLGTTHRQLHDMKALKIVSCRAEEKRVIWKLNPKARDLVAAAKLEDV